MYRCVFSGVLARFRKWLPSIYYVFIAKTTFWLLTSRIYAKAVVSSVVSWRAFASGFLFLRFSCENNVLATDFFESMQKRVFESRPRETRRRSWRARGCQTHPLALPLPTCFAIRSRPDSCQVDADPPAEVLLIRSNPNNQ